MNRLIVGGLVVVALFAAGWAYIEVQARKRAELQLGIDSSRIVAQVFTAKNQLKVLEIRGKVTARVVDEGMIFDNEQRINAPYTVDYFVDLSKIQPGRFGWNPAAKTLVVEVPDPFPAKPNIDEERATVSQRGIFISRASALRLARKSTKLMDTTATADARKPEHMQRARDAAREALRQNALAPLRAAKVDVLNVEIRFTNQVMTNDDVWDYTTRIEDVPAKIEAMKRSAWP